MSKEYSPNPALEVAKWVLGTAVGMGIGVAVTTTSLLLAEHLKRKMDKGLVHWPGRPDLPIHLGVPPPGVAVVVEPPAPKPAPIPGLNLSGLVELPV